MENKILIREGKLIKISQKIVEAKKDRIVSFVGRITKVRGIGVNKSVTVRQVIENVDVDRIFPVNSPTIVKIELVEETKQKEKKATKSKKKKK